MIVGKNQCRPTDFHGRRWWRTVHHTLSALLLSVAFTLSASGAAQALIAPSSSTPSSPTQTDAALTPAPTLVIGSVQDYPPFSTGMTDATAGGFSVELWKAVANEAGLQYTIKVHPFHQLLQEFHDGKIDVLINLAQSDERRRFADFSVTHVIVHGAIFARKGQSDIRSENDLAGKSIIVMNGDLAHDYAVAKGWGKQLVLVETVADGMRLLASGKQDAMLLSRLVGLQTINSLELTNLKALETKVGFAQKFAFATRPGQTELLAKLNEAMAITKANGVYDSLYEKWFGIYEVREVGLRDTLKYVIPVTAFFMLWIGYLLYRRKVERELTFAAVASSRDLLRTIIDHAPVRVYSKNRELRYLGGNAAFAKDAGVASPEDLVGKDDFQMDWAAQAERYRADDQAVMDSGVAKLFYEEPQTTPDGQTIWLRASKVPLKNQDNETIGLLGMYEDITERKQIDEKLRQLSIAVEQSPASVVITDLNANIQYVNPRFTEVTGYSAAEVIGQNSRILQSNQTGKEVFKDLWRTLTSGLVWHGELINRRKNGQIYWEDSQIAPVRNEQGTITHYVAIKTDVTERIRSAERMDTLMREQNAILQNKLFGIVTVQDRKIIWANPAFEQMLGYAAGELTGTPTCQNYLNDEAYLAFGNAAYQALADDKMFRSQIEYVRKDGTHIWVDVSGGVLNKQTGESLWGFIDITETKRLEEEVLQQALHDPLTKLANRRMLGDRLTQAMAASQRSARFGAVMALDLDNFKPLNDQHGHLVGDLLLIEVANRLTNCVREVDTVARVGGDEFVVMLTELDSEGSVAKLQAQVIAEKIRVSLAQPYLLLTKGEELAEATIEHHCSASMGCVLFFKQEALLRWADEAMYQAKEAGRNAIRFYDESHQE